ncbi:cytochrome P450 [Daedaleopsis nitida]|nr:cytochrome P450 [Daedaleopsis nitida]
MISVPAEYLTGAAAAGVGSWLYLNKHDLRGDHGFLLYTGALASLYAACRNIPALSECAGCFTALLASTYIATLISVTAAYRLSPWHPLASYPGPLLARISSLWLVYVSFWGRRHLVVHHLHERYGPFVRIGPNALSINTSSATSLYLTMEKGEAYRYPAHDDVVAIFFKLDSKEQHRERKKIWGGMFTPNGLNQLIPTLEQRTWEVMECIERRQAAGNGFIEMVEIMYHVSYDFMGDMVFSGCNKLELMKNGDPKDYVETAKLASVMMDVFGQAPWLLDILWHVPATKDMHGLVKLAEEMTRDRMAAKELPRFKDLMSYLRDIERDAVVAILAGTESTSIVMALACYFLVAEPRYFQQLRAELEQAFKDPLGEISLKTLGTLAFLDGVINESLRLGLPFFLPRVAGTTVALAAHSQHMSPDNFYPDPENFRPERWLPDGLGPETKTSKTVLSTFSYGQHGCIGKTLAYHTMRYVLGRLVLAYDMEFQSGFDVRAFRDGFMNIRTALFEKPLSMKLTRRPGVDLNPVFAKLAQNQIA